MLTCWRKLRKSSLSLNSVSSDKQLWTSSSFSGMSGSIIFSTLETICKTSKTKRVGASKKTYSDERFLLTHKTRASEVGIGETSKYFFFQSHPRNGNRINNITMLATIVPSHEFDQRPSRIARTCSLALRRIHSRSRHFDTRGQWLCQEFHQSWWEAMCCSERMLLSQNEQYWVTWAENKSHQMCWNISILALADWSRLTVGVYQRHVH